MFWQLPNLNCPIHLAGAKQVIKNKNYVPNYRSLPDFIAKTRQNLKYDSLETSAHELVRFAILAFLSYIFFKFFLFKKNFWR